MDGTKHICRGFNAAQSQRVQIQNTLQTMRQLRAGHDIRMWSASSRKELTMGTNVTIMAKDGTTAIGSAPKLALVVISSIFRRYLEQNPDAQAIKVADGTDVNAIAALLNWINEIVTKPNGRFGVNVPGFPTQLVKVRYAAFQLGMEIYVSHFPGTYKKNVCNRVPTVNECLLVENCAVGANDTTVQALGERLGCLRRRGQFRAADLSQVNDVLAACEKIGRAVRDADARSPAKRVDA